MAYTPENNPYAPGDPYSYDLKWVVSNIKDLIANYTGQIDELKAFIMDYINSLDLSAEVDAKIEQMYIDGYFDAAIADWLNDHTVWTNPCILDNSWFTVNQRGAAIITSTNYGADRWEFIDGTSATFGSAGVELNAARIRQKLENQLPNGTYTASFIYNGTPFSGTATKEDNVTDVYFISGSPMITIVYKPTSKSFEIDNRIQATNLNIEAVKLEKGDYATLANDVPPNYQQELAKCQRYFVRFNAGAIGTGIFREANRLITPIALPVPMRANPSLAVAGTLTVQTTLNNNVISQYLTGDFNGSMVMISTTISSGGTAGAAAILAASANAYIDISADL